MKLSHDSFLRMSKNPLGATKSLLFYGDSEFWVQSKIDHFLKNNPTLTPFLPRSIPQELILENKSLLSTVFFTKDFFSGPEIILITQATDKITSLIEDFNLQSVPFFILNAREYLKPTSKLRRLYEGHPNFFSVPCYELSSVELEKEVHSFFTHHQKKISSSLARRIGELFHASPDTLKRELEKILTYIGSKETVESIDLKNLVSFSHQTDTLDLVNAFLDKDKKKVINSINSLDETASYISVLRTLGASLSRFHQVKQELSLGTSLEKSMKILIPPVLFNEQDLFKKRLSLWSTQEIETILKKGVENEISIKLNSKIAKEIFEFFFLKTLVLV